MRILGLMLSAAVFLALSCGGGDRERTASVVAEFGTTPTIDGVLEEGEWGDAGVVHPDSTKKVRFKHDGENLYIAVDGDGGNLHFLKDDEIHILHASWSLGRAEYSRCDDSTWSLARAFEWELYRIQEQPEDEIRRAIAGYLEGEGWVGSIVPMGTPQQSEFAVSLRWLDIGREGVSRKTAKLPRLFISSFQNLNPVERERRGLTAEDLRLRWPPAAVPVDSIGRGYAPARINMDTSTWGEVLVRF